jgi:hypothetical protein
MPIHAHAFEVQARYSPPPNFTSSRHNQPTFCYTTESRRKSTTTETDDITSNYAQTRRSEPSSESITPLTPIPIRHPHLWDSAGATPSQCECSPHREAQAWAFQKVTLPRLCNLHLLTTNHQDQLVTNITNITSNGVKHQRLYPSTSSSFAASPPEPSNKITQTRFRPRRCTQKG